MPSRMFSRTSPSNNPHARAEDAVLVAACLGGDASAWDALLARYEGLIYSLILRAGLSGSDAEDVFQDVCVLLLNHLGDLRDVSRLAGWLAATTKREAWRLQRRRGIAPPTTSLDEAPEPPSDAADSPEGATIALEEGRLVREALDRLPERCRRLLTLLYVEEPPASYADTAARLGLPLGSIGPSRARCLQRLQKILQTLDF